MKRFIVYQTGVVQLEASRRFLLEVPDDISEEQAQELVEDEKVPLPEDEGMEWCDDLGRKWVGYEVEVEEIEVCDSETGLGFSGTEGLRVYSLESEATLHELKMAQVEISARLEAMTNVELLGAKQVADLRGGEIASRLEEKDCELNDWCDWDLLGYGSTRKSRSRRSPREAAIERRLEAEEEALGKMTDEDLIGKDYLAKLRQEEIERRLGDSDDQ